MAARVAVKDRSTGSELYYPCREPFEKLSTALDELQLVLRELQRIEPLLRSALGASVDQELLLASRALRGGENQEGCQSAVRSAAGLVEHAMLLRVQLHELLAGLACDLEDDMDKVRVTEDCVLARIREKC